MGATMFFKRMASSLARVPSRGTRVHVLLRFGCPALCRGAIMDPSSGPCCLGRCTGCCQIRPDPLPSLKSP